LKYLKTLSQTPYIGIVKGFFNGNIVGYDAAGYAIRVAQNYDCLISKVKGTVWSQAKCIAQGLNSNVDYACTNAMTNAILNNFSELFGLLSGILSCHFASMFIILSIYLGIRH
jgi:hypothetical protein